MSSAAPPTPHLPGSPEVSGPVTDFALIESQKENIRPLASGRSAATLGVLFDKRSADEASRVVQEGIERFQRDIEEAERRDREGEDMVDGVQDVLDVYNRYVAFLIQHFPSSPAQVLPLLESTTRRFVDDARYAQDARYLKLWVMYARQVERREEVWSFLESRDIGTRHANFYEEWAAALEGLGRRKKADDVYRLGIARKAAPTERLKNRHAAFLTRIMAPPNGVVPDDAHVAPAPQAMRTALGGGGSSGGLGGLSGASQSASSSRISSARNGAKMMVFNEEAAGPSEQPEATPWDDFGTRDGRRKENTVDATPWKGETLKQGRPMAPRTPKLEVFKDSGDGGNVVHAAQEVLGGLRPKAPASDAERLRADPLRNFDTAGVSSGVPTIPALPAPPSARKPPPAKRSKKEHHFQAAPWVCPTGGAETKDSRGKTERRMFDWDATFRGGEEWSFEEVRARKLGLFGRDWKELKSWEHGWHKAGATTPKPVKIAARPPSPTVNTKLANEEVMSLFNQTIHGGKVRDYSDDDDSSDEDDDGEEDDEMTGLPTPLPPRHQPVAMMTPGGMVPPTPCPAPGARMMPIPQTPVVFADENAGAMPSARKLNIFSDENAGQDENAVPPSSVRKLAVFDETPAKQPLAARTPLASSSSKPRAFGVYDADAENQPAAATPMPSRGNIFAKLETEAYGAIPEEPEEPEEEEQYAAEAEAEAQESEYSEDEPEQRRYGRLGQFSIMTPITERTCEYTTFTTGRKSRISTFSEVDEGMSEGGALSTGAILAGIAEEEASARASPSPHESMDQDQDQANSNSGDFDRSGFVDTGAFGVPEGYTIARKLDDVDMDSTTGMLNTLEVVDHSNTTQPAAELANPCNPADEAIISSLLRTIDPPLSALPLYVNEEGTTSNRLPALQRAAKQRSRRSSAASLRSSIAASEDAYVLTLGGKQYEVAGKLGEGGFGAVFLAVDVAIRDAAEDASDDDEDEAAALVAVKVEHPGCQWEAAILDRVHRRVDATLLPSIICPRGLHAYADESFLLLNYSNQGTLLDVVNKAIVWGIAAIPSGPSTLDELAALFFAAELLKLVEGLHAADIIHGDLKIDNCLVRLDPIPASEGGATAWASQYSQTGANGWSHKGVRLIDFGRSQDLTLFPAGRGQTFVADWRTDERDCIEMREGRPWSYETDYYGLAGICYCMLFGKFMVTESVDAPGGGAKRVKIDQPFKRYWQTDLWTRLFDTLLNPHAQGDVLPITNNLTALRVEIQGWLEENCQKGGKSLKQLLKRIELRALESRRL